MRRRTDKFTVDTMLCNECQKAMFVPRGSSAQEECLCRCSGLYFCLSVPEMMNGFYYPHRNAKNPINNADIIYTPDVTVFKTDTS